MPRGPRGERRPADAIGCAIAVGRIATGQDREELIPISGKVRSGKAGSEARKRALAPAKRKEIAVTAAKKRWAQKKVEVDMEKTAEKRTAPEDAGDDFVRMYPCNQLKEQVRDPKETLSAFEVLKDTFFKGS